MATVSSINYNPQSIKNNNTISFKHKDDNESDSEKKVEYRYIEKPRAKSSKKWGVGIASLCIPGLGQLINGEGAGKVLGFFGGTVAFGILANVALFSTTKHVTESFDSALTNFTERLAKMEPGEVLDKIKTKTTTTECYKRNALLIGIAIIGNLAIRVASIVDAVKHAKPDDKKPKMKIVEE